MIEDLRWFGFEWSEGPDIGGKFAPYNQNERFSFYHAALEKLRTGNFIYPCACSRKDIQSAVNAPHAADDELIYPGTCRTKNLSAGSHLPSVKFCWRFRISNGETISFADENLGEQKFTAGK